MKEKANIFQRVLEKFKFGNPLSVKDQKFILLSMRRTLVFTLKAVKEYTAFYGMVLRIYFRAMRMGMRLSVTQSAFILGIISTVAALAVAGGIAVTPRLFMPNRDVRLPKKKTGAVEPYKQDRSKGDLKKGANAEEALPGRIKKKKAALRKYRLGIEVFGNENIGADKSERITGRIKMRLVESLGKGKVLSLDAGKRKHVNLILTGSVGRLGDLIMISAKVIDVEKGSAILITSENIGSEDDINSACDRISRKIWMKIRQ